MSRENEIVLRKMAIYIRRHGFSAEWGDHGGPRCFVGAASSCRPPSISNSIDMTSLVAMSALNTALGVPFAAYRLQHEGWNTKDAAAACTIAASDALAKKLGLRWELRETRST